MTAGTGPDPGALSAQAPTPEGAGGAVRPASRWLPAGHPLRDRIRRGDSYILLLGLITADYFVLSVWNGRDRWSTLVVVALTDGMLLSALRTSRVRPGLMRVAQGAAVAGFTLALVDAFAGSVSLDRAITATVSVLLVGAPVAVIVRIAQHPAVTVETVVGAIDVYLLVGILFASVYATINALGGPFFVQTANPTSNQFVYFSFVTLTTLGYGDLTPARDGGRSLVVIEAMAGQVYLVTVVARLVSLLGTGRRPT